ncbi:hypothetical protein LMB49_10630 [Limosilactobacillus reuteri]|uniref:hypothetical protein n=1 Tax=Limosilactobacillus reuteri TaxID=1598 RepID=UPI001E3EC6D0|nr:hypothetical protein [Limosilactobacillus reuteri]MCC4370584.1 hypothetical protein [Limosilactobacillus reuteri]MCC4371847.1 hypothetical protein [Limosilactobacillus reuteri]MCC4509318.1 hypothetical protein [Limosilactobacillus reuteri]MCC4509361.1 hypothetical protein [Limosilactobacillus reuteri]
MTEKSMITVAELKKQRDKDNKAFMDFAHYLQNVDLKQPSKRKGFFAFGKSKGLLSIIESNIKYRNRKGNNTFGMTNQELLKYIPSFDGSRNALTQYYKVSKLSKLTLYEKNKIISESIVTNLKYSLEPLGFRCKRYMAFLDNGMIFITGFTIEW